LNNLPAEFIEQAKGKPVFCHLNIPGVVPGVEKEIGHGVPAFLPEWAKDCKAVFAGHIHRGMTIGKTHILGSVLRVTVSEQYDTGFMAIIDHMGNILNKSRIESRPLSHFVLDATGGKSIDLPSILEKDLNGHIVSVVITVPRERAHEVNQVKLQEQLREKCYNARLIVDVVNEKEIRMKELDPAKSDLELVKMFLSKHKVGDEKEVLTCVEEALRNA
jgi:hypothetical protein